LGVASHLSTRGHPIGTNGTVDCPRIDVLRTSNIQAHQRSSRVKELRRYGSGMGLFASPTLVPWSGTGLDASPSHRRPVWERDGTSPIPDEVRGTESRPWDIVGEGASHIPVQYWPSVLDGDGSRLIPDEVLGSGTAVAPSSTHSDPFLNPERVVQTDLVSG
jgi:hypothetical protein